MAFTRKFLAALGIEQEKIDEIINAHTEVTDALKAERDKYKSDAEKLPGVQGELDDLKSKAAKDGGENPFEKKYNDLKKEYDDYKKGVTEKETKASKTAAFRALLKEAGISEKRLDAIIKVSDVDSIKLDKDGNIEGKDDLLKNVKAEWSEFISTTSTAGAQTATPPASAGGARKTKAEIIAIKDAAERQKAIAENHDLFGF